MKRAVSDVAASAAGESFTDVVYGQLKADILWGRLSPGEALRSEELRRRYDIGISPLREALTRLASEQLVIRLPQKGFRVATLDAAEVNDVLETRLIVEGEALRLSMARGDIEWESGILVASHALGRALQDTALKPETPEWSAVHRRFHLSLLSGCKSPTLLHFAEILYDRAERHRMVGETWRARVESSGAVAGRNRAGEHETISQFVLAGDFNQAMEALRRHYMLTAQSVLHVLGYKDSAPGEGTKAAPAKAGLRKGAA